MLDSYISPTYPYNILYIIQNHLVVNLISYLSYKKNFIDKKVFILLLIFSIIPLIFNNSLLSWTNFPDQSKYFYYAKQLRLLNFEYFNIFERVQLSSLIYSLIFFFNIQDFNSIAFINRLLINILIIYLVYRKFDKFVIIFFLFYPSIILYSGLALREVLIIFISFFLILFLFKKKIMPIILFSFLLYILKVEVFYFIMTFFLTNTLFNKKNFLFNNVIKKSFFLFLIFIIFIIIFFNFSEILYYINFKRTGYFAEEFGGYRSLSTMYNYDPVAIDLITLKNLLNSFYLIFITPNPFYLNNLSFVKILYSIENITLIIFLYYFYKKIFYYNKILCIIYAFILIFFLFFSHLIIFNLGNYLRQKFIFCTLAIIFLELFLNKKKIN